LKNIVNYYVNDVQMSNKYIFVSLLFLFLISSCDDEVSKPEPKTSRVDMFCGGIDNGPDISDDGLSAKFLTHKVSLPTGLYTVNIKLALDDGENLIPVTDLEESNIIISDNGDVQFSLSDNINEMPEDFTIVSKPTSFEQNLMILIDVSGDVLQNLPEFKSSLNNFIDEIFDEVSPDEEGQLSIGLYYFAGDPEIKVLKEFSSNEIELKEAVRSLSSDLDIDYSSNLFGSVIESVDLLLNLSEKSAEESTSSTLIVFTDRKEYTNIKTKDELDSALDSLKFISPSSQIISIGLGDKIRTEELENIGRDGYYFAEDFFDLENRFSEISESVNSDLNSYYSIMYCSGRRGGEAEINILIDYEGKTSEISTCLNAENIKDDCNGN
jgi:hypothetical protein